MQNTKEIAILLCTYNGETYLAAQLDSILSQTFKDWTLYIRDDGSNDDTVNIIKEYCKKDDRMVFIEEGGKKIGPALGFMALLEAVDSELYMFCDQDDVWLDKKIEKTYQCYKAVTEHKNKPVVIHSDVTVVDEHLNIMAKSYWLDINLNPDKINKYNYLCICCYTNGNTMLFNRNAKILCYPLVNNIVMHDKYVSSRVLKHQGIIEAIHEPLVLYRQHGLNVCGFKVGEKNSILNRLKCIPSVVKSNIQGYRNLKDYDFGSFFKYLWYKFLVEYHLHFSKNYCS